MDMGLRGFQSVTGQHAIPRILVDPIFETSAIRWNAELLG
jgi:hypothetical protein